MTGDEVAPERPLRLPDEERLGRGPLVERLHRLLTESPAGWPVRVALTGAWGEGKTSLANLVCERALRPANGEPRQHHLVVRFDVSTIAGKDEVWIGFVRAFSQAIDEAKLLQPHELPWRRLEGAKFLPAAAKHARTVSGMVGWAISAAVAVPAVGDLLAGAAVLGVEALRRLLGLTEEAVRKLRAELGADARIIVVIDDLDRADPATVPEILLRLRDLLEIDGFSFLVLFDREVVRRTLETVNPAWAPADRFLEKIFDYEITIPRPRPPPASPTCWRSWSDIARSSRPRRSSAPASTCRPARAS